MATSTLSGGPTTAATGANRSFSSLGQALSAPVEHDVLAETAKDAHWTARKACAVLRLSSSVMNALAVYPGAGATESEMAEASTQLMERAAALTQAALGILQVNPVTRSFSGYKNLLRQQAVEFVSAQWRMAHVPGARELSVEQVASLFERVVRDNPLSGDGETMQAPQGIDPVTAKRVSLLAVTPEIYQAVNAFDYFAPDSHALVQNGVRAVVASAEDGMRKLVHPSASTATHTMVAQSLIGKMGSLYAANYRAQSRKDVLELQSMDQDQRLLHLTAHRLTGLPTAHLDASFQELATRLVDMVCDAIPELAQPPVEPAPAPCPAATAPVQTSNNTVHPD